MGLHGHQPGGTGQRREAEAFLGVQEAAAMLRVSPRTLYGWVSQRAIPYRKAGRRVLFLASELLEWTKPDPGRPHSQFTSR